MDELTERINFLAKKARRNGAYRRRKSEQKALREKYLRQFRASFKGVLDNAYIQYPDGTKKKIGKKELKAARCAAFIILLNKVLYRLPLSVPSP